MLQRASDYEEPDLATAAVWAREHAVFVDEVFTWFLRVGKWPTVNDLQQWLDQHDQNLNVVALAQDMPRVLGSHWRGPDGELKLGIRGLRDCAPATPYLEAAMDVLQLAWTLYKTPGAKQSLDASDLPTKLLQTAAILLQHEEFNIIHGGVDRWDPNWGGLINKSLVREVRAVTTVDDYLAVEAEFFRARATPSPMGSQLSLGAIAVPPDQLRPATAFTLPRPTTGDIFIVHGSNVGTKEAVARLVERITHLEPIILHEQANQGRTLIEKFEDHGALAGYALVLLTGDDVGAAKQEVDETAQAFASRLQPRGRQNVVFEFGYFVGRLRRPRVALLYESGTELPSDLDGLVYIELDQAGAWRAKLARELSAAGFAVDWEALGKA